MIDALKVVGPVGLAVACGSLALRGASPEIKPVTPDALPEVHALLGFFHGISGRHMLTGQHNFPNTGDRNSVFAAKYTGKTPVIFGVDFGFAKEGDKDSYLARPAIIEESIRQHRLGAIVHICWHAVPPTADEPVTFQPLPNSDPKTLASVQGKLLDEQFKELLTPGTPLHQRWCAQVDVIAAFLKQLEAARVPVLWRPYHEMNGDWFWWGGRTGQFSTAALYRQIFERMVHHHQLKNLVWVWSVDRVSKPGFEHEPFFPGTEYLDMLSLDVYQNDFAQSYYDSLVALAQGKPLALAEVGNPPSLDILAQQPLWTFYMTWAGMVRNTSLKDYDALMQDPRVLGLEDPDYARAIAPLRQVGGLPPLSPVPAPVDFSGLWVLNAEKSALGRQGAGFAPARIQVAHRAGEVVIQTTRVLEYADDEVTEETLTLDGAERQSPFQGRPRVMTARMSPDAQQLEIGSEMTTPRGPPGSKVTTKEIWTLNRRGDGLTIQRTATSPRGEQQSTLVFDRR